MQNANPQVGFVEFIGDVPTDRAELAPLLHDSVEEAQRVQELLEILALNTAFEEFGIANRIARIGSQDVGPESLRRLVRYLDAVLKNRDGKMFRWITGQPQPEIRVNRIG